MVSDWAGLRIFSIGHSTRPQEELISILQAHGVRTLVDVRTVPRSRTNPQFNREELERVIPRAGMRYVHLAALGGLRHGLGARSPNTAWRNASFRGYADHMQTPEFEEGLRALREIASEGPAAVMCAEALRWRCHRTLIADALFARGVVIEHIESARRAVPHRLTEFARIGTDGKVTYPGEPPRERTKSRRGGTAP